MKRSTPQESNITPTSAESDQEELRDHAEPAGSSENEAANSRSASVEDSLYTPSAEHARIEELILENLKRLGLAIHSASNEQEAEKLCDEAVEALARYREFCEAYGFPFESRNLQAQNMLLHEVTDGELKANTVDC
ncbi:hypothetical protein TRVA0_034S00782 [Trichomonascus vanleenenianus]|uniref:uncharacterized protein n=1 Tax=Trichomonascus vanleenenianus TaxID=2268995 RepID=UPI003ECB1D8E